MVRIIIVKNTNKTITLNIIFNFIKVYCFRCVKFIIKDIIFGQFYANFLIY
jgi:hypothetical protein